MYFFIFILFVINSFWPRAQRIQFKKRKQLHAYKQAIDLPDSLQASLPEADRHDTSSIYRKLTLRELQREVPQIHWRLYLQEFLSSPITNDEHVVAYAIPYFVQMGRIVEKTDRRYKLLLFKIIRQIIKFVELINVINFFFFLQNITQLYFVAFGHVDNAPHDRWLSTEESRVWKNPFGNFERKKSMVSVCWVDQQETWDGCGCTFHTWQF